MVAVRRGVAPVVATSIRSGSEHCERCRRYCCACAALITRGAVSRRGHLYCSIGCALSGNDCGGNRRPR